MVVFYKMWKNYDKIQSTKNKMDLNHLKIKDQPPSAGESGIIYSNNLHNYCYS